MSFQVRQFKDNFGAWEVYRDMSIKVTTVIFNGADAPTQQRFLDMMGLRMHHLQTDKQTQPLWHGTESVSLIVANGKQFLVRDGSQQSYKAMYAAGIISMCLRSTENADKKIPITVSITDESYDDVTLKFYSYAKTYTTHGRIPPFVSGTGLPEDTTHPDNWQGVRM